MLVSIASSQLYSDLLRHEKFSYPCFVSYGFPYFIVKFSCSLLKTYQMNTDRDFSFFSCTSL